MSDEKYPAEIGGIAAEFLKQAVDRVERLREEGKAINEDISQVYKEARAHGFDVKIIKRLIAERAKDPQEVEEDNELLEIYRAAVNGTVPATRVGTREAAE